MSKIIATLSFLLAMGLVVAYAAEKSSGRTVHKYVKALTLGPGTEWRFHPLVIDINKDGHADLVATARLVKPALHIWQGNGKGALEPLPLTTSDIGYGALATADINGDGFPDIVLASHFGSVQTLLSNGKGGFTEKVFRGKDGYTAAQLADVNEDGHPDLILVGYETAGIEIYFGDGKGNWTLHSTLPQPPPGETMPGRALAVADLNGDGHLDIVAAFQRWGVYVYYGNGRGEFSGGNIGLASENGEFQSIAVGDVNKDGHPDIVINGASLGRDQPNGPDVYLGDGRGRWRPSSAGLKVFKYAAAGLALGDLDGDGKLDIVAAGNLTGNLRDGYGLFWFKGDGKGGWRRVKYSGLPSGGFRVIHSITLADLDGHGRLDVIALAGGRDGNITIWKRR